jgi:hypothetical protein
MGGGIMAVVINGTTGVDKVQDGSIGTADLASGAVTAAKLNVGQIGGRRNLIINGAMQVAQRGTVSFNDANGYGGPDRFMAWVNGTTGTVNVSQSNNAPDGFSNSYRIETTSAGNFSAGGSYQIWGQLFEGQNLQGLAFGTSSAKTVTASFWVRSSQTGIMNIEFRNNSASKHNISQYTINSANTWEYKTITFTGDTVSGFANSNALGAYLIHWGKSGSSYNTGTAPTSGWVSLSSTNFAAGATLDYISGVGRYIEFTGIQFEVGDTATPFEHRSYGEELALCQRYFQRKVVPQDYNDSLNNSAQYSSFDLANTMRANGTVSVRTQIRYWTSGNAANTTPTLYGYSDHILMTATGLTSGRGWIDGEVNVDAEL